MCKIKKIGIIILLITISLYINILKFNANNIENSNIIIEEKVYINSDLELAYLIYLPNDYNINNKYRLVLFMHGAGDRGFDYDILHKIDYGFITTYINNQKYYQDTILIVPQCPIPYLWVDDSWESGEYSFTSNPSPAIKAVKELVDSIINSYNIDTTKIYTTGVSMGGMAVWDLIARYPGFFAAAAPVCGALDPTKINEYLKTPIFTCNDLRDTIICATPTYNTANNLLELNHDIVYKIYDTDVRNDLTCHSTWIDAYSIDKSENNLYNFLFSHELEINNDNNNSNTNENINNPRENNIKNIFKYFLLISLPFLFIIFIIKIYLKKLKNH